MSKHTQAVEKASSKYIQTLEESMSLMACVLENALTDINWLLVEGFDTNADECSIDGVGDTIEEIKLAIAMAEVGGD